MQIYNFDRFNNPLSSTLGLDTLPDFVPNVHYTQVLRFCIEAVEFIKAKKDCCFTLSEINLMIEEYAELFKETEIWINQYSNFEPFSLVYLEFCEMKVFIEDFGKKCANALNEVKELNKTDWIEKYEPIYQHIHQIIDFNSKEFLNDSFYVPLKDSKFLIPRKEILKHWEFSNCYSNEVIDFKQGLLH